MMVKSNTNMRIPIVNSPGTSGNNRLCFSYNRLLLSNPLSIKYFGSISNPATFLLLLPKYDFHFISLCSARGCHTPGYMPPMVSMQRHILFSSDFPSHKQRMLFSSLHQIPVGSHYMKILELSWILQTFSKKDKHFFFCPCESFIYK